MKSVFAYTCLALLFPGVSIAAPEFSFSVGATHSTADTIVPEGYAFQQHEPPPDAEFTGRGLRLTGGVRTSPWLGFKASYSRIGADTTTIRLFDEFEPGVVYIMPPTFLQRVERKGSTYWLAWSPSFRMDDLEFSLTVGSMRTDIRNVHLGTDVVEKRTERGLMVGAGIGWHFGERFGLGFDYESFDGAASQAAVSLTYRF